MEVHWLSAREHIPDVEIFGSNRSEVNLQKSLDLGLINFRLEDALIKQMDVILLTIPVDVAMDRLVDLLDEVNDNALIIDFGSTKACHLSASGITFKARAVFGHSSHCWN